MSNYWVFGASQSITLCFAAMSHYQGWFAHFSAGPVGRQARQKTVQRKSLFELLLTLHGLGGKLLFSVKFTVLCELAMRLSENGYFPQPLRQAQIITLEILKCMDACPAVFKRGGYDFRLLPLKVRDLRLDLGKNISFSDSLLSI